MFWRIRHVFMDQANAGEGGGVSAGAVAQPTDAAASQPATQPAAGVPDGSNTAGQSALAQAAQPISPQIPEKYQVKKEDGTLDIEASSLKLAEAYGHLEKRFGSGDLPPKAATEYQISVPEVMKDQWNPSEDPKLQDFLGKAHAAGLTQKQMDLVMSSYFETAQEIITGNRQLSADECVAELKQEWKTDDQFKAEVGKAFKAAQAYGDKDAQAIINDYGNDPRIIRLLSRIGGELGEDTPPGTGDAMPAGQTVEGLMLSDAYTNPKHPDHARISAQVQGFFAKQAQAAAKSGNVPVL